MRRSTRPARDLRAAIGCMPPQTRRAMLDALDADPIIVGAYADRDGGVCPMLAAHRNGGRTSHASFAEAWDRYARAGGTPRPATEREVQTLKTMLAASMVDEDVGGAGALGAAIAEHRAAKDRRLRERPVGERAARERPEPAARDTGGPTVPAPRDTGEHDRSAELRHRPAGPGFAPSAASTSTSARSRSFGRARTASACPSRARRRRG